MGKKQITTSLQIAGLAILYFSFARFGLHFASYHQAITFIWPPTGIAIVAIWFMGNRVWPGIFLGAMLVNMTTGLTFPFVLFAAIGNTAEAIVATYLLRRQAVFTIANGRIHFNFPWFIISISLGAAISATMGLTGLLAANGASEIPTIQLWLVWWLGNFMGAAIIVPFCLVWRTKWPTHWQRRDWLTLTFMLLLSILLSLFIFSGYLPVMAQIIVIGYLIIPLSLYIAYRYQFYGATLAMLCLSLMALLGAIPNNNPIYGFTINQLVFITLYLNVTNLLILVTATLVERREELEASLQISRYAIHNAQDIMFRLAPKGHILDVNEATCTILGYTREELIGQPIQKIDPTYRTESWEIIRQGHQLVFTTAFQAKNQIPVPMELSVSYLSYQGQEFAFASARNIAKRAATENALRESEEKYRMLVESSLMGIFIIDDGRFSFVNSTMTQFTGYSTAELLAMDTKQVQQLIHPDDLETIIQHFTDTLEQESDVRTHKFRILHRHNEPRWVEIQFSFVQLHAETVIPSIVCVCVDITERMQAEEALRHTQKTESLGVLAGGIAHDFNNLLVAMIGQTSLALAKMDADAPARRHVEKSLLAAERAANLTKQLLAYSGRGQFELANIHLNALIEENIHLFEMARPAHVQLILQLSPVPLCIEGDTGQIQQVIMNLLINGYEAIGAKPGQMVIHTEKVVLEESDEALQKSLGARMKPGAYALLSIHDSGVGMLPETAVRIFDPFFSTKFTGRGLGLAAVLGIIRSMNGGIIVESAIEQGTTFHLYFPLSTESCVGESMMHHA
jgi:PAS domain S-box-containing protein